MEETSNIENDRPKKSYYRNYSRCLLCGATKKSSPDRGFFRFPTNELLDKWIEYTGLLFLRNGKLQLTGQRLCSAHFLSSDVSRGVTKAVLRRGAIPSVPFDDALKLRTLRKRLYNELADGVCQESLLDDERRRQLLASSLSDSNCSMETVQKSCPPSVEDSTAPSTMGSSNIQILPIYNTEQQCSPKIVSCLSLYLQTAVDGTLNIVGAIPVSQESNLTEVRSSVTEEVLPTDKEELTVAPNVDLSSATLKTYTRKKSSVTAVPTVSEDDFSFIEIIPILSCDEGDNDSSSCEDDDHDDDFEKTALVTVEHFDASTPCSILNLAKQLICSSDFAVSYHEASKRLTLQRCANAVVQLEVTFCDGKVTAKVFNTDLPGDHPLLAKQLSVTELTSSSAQEIVDSLRAWCTCVGIAEPDLLKAFHELQCKIGVLKVNGCVYSDSCSLLLPVGDIATVCMNCKKYRKTLREYASRIAHRRDDPSPRGNLRYLSHKQLIVKIEDINQKKYFAEQRCRKLEEKLRRLTK